MQLHRVCHVSGEYIMLHYLFSIERPCFKITPQKRCLSDFVEITEDCVRNGERREENVNFTIKGSHFRNGKSLEPQREPISDSSKVVLIILTPSGYVVNGFMLEGY